MTSSQPWYQNPEWWGIIFSTALGLAALTQTLWGPRLKAVFWPRKICIHESLLPDIGFGVAGALIWAVRIHCE
jgi:hypothetical protein